MMIRSWFWRQWPLPTPSWGTPWKKLATPEDFPNPKNGDFAEAHVLSCKTITVCLQQFHERILFLNHTTLVLPQNDSTAIASSSNWGSCQLGSAAQLSYRLSDKTVDNTLNSYKVHNMYRLHALFVQPKNSTSPTWISPKKKGDLYP